MLLFEEHKRFRLAPQYSFASILF